MSDDVKVAEAAAAVDGDLRAHVARALLRAEQAGQAVVEPPARPVAQLTEYHDEVTEAIARMFR